MHIHLPVELQILVGDIDTKSGKGFSSPIWPILEMMRQNRHRGSKRLIFYNHMPRATVICLPQKFFQRGVDVSHRASAQGRIFGDLEHPIGPDGKKHGKEQVDDVQAVSQRFSSWVSRVQGLVDP